MHEGATSKTDEVMKGILHDGALPLDLKWTWKMFSINDLVADDNFRASIQKGSRMAKKGPAS